MSLVKHNRSELERHIGDCAWLFGWQRHHDRLPGIARDGYPDGFPSETLIRSGRLVFITIAPASGRLTQREEVWVKALNGVLSVESHVLRTGDLAEFRRGRHLLDPSSEPEQEVSA